MTHKLLLLSSFSLLCQKAAQPLQIQHIINKTIKRRKPSKSKKVSKFIDLLCHRTRSTNTIIKHRTQENENKITNNNKNKIKQNKIKHIIMQVKNTAIQLSQT